MGWENAKVNVGCGRYALPGWVNVDAVPGPGVDVVLNLHTDLNQLPTDQLAHVYASHVIEHVYPNLLVDVIGNLRRALRPGGTLTLATIDLEGIYHNWYKTGAANGTAWTSALYGSANAGDNPLDAHRNCFTYATLARLLTVAGFSNIRPWEYAKYPELAALNDCGLSCRAVSVLIEGDK